MSIKQYYLEPEQVSFNTYEPTSGMLDGKILLALMYAVVEGEQHLLFFNKDAVDKLQEAIDSYRKSYGKKVEGIPG